MKDFDKKIVSYRSGRYKAVAVPFCEDMENAVRVSDFSSYNRIPMTDPTELYLRRDAYKLYMTVVCHEASGKIDAHVSPKGNQVWNGSDRLEIFFGAVEPVPWMVQLAVSANDYRFDSTGNYDAWAASVSVGKNCWSVEISIALNYLKIQDMSCGFNLARISHGDKRISVWSRMEHLFHEFENFGELFFCDYQTAYMAKLGQGNTQKLDRQHFEEVISRNMISAEQILHGPWLSNPSRNSMTISFGTAGCAGAQVEYREKGEDNWIRLDCQRSNGVLARNRKIHICNITGLRPGCEYEYRVVTLKPVTLQANYSAVYVFHTNPEEAQPFSMILFSDIHSNAEHVRKVMSRPEVAKADFLVNLGDFLSCTSGPDGYYDAFLDLQCEHFGKERPLVFVRGNHEQVGIFADLINEMLPHPSGQTYYHFVYAGVMFVVLDPGNDHEDDITQICRNSARNRQQKEWLYELSETPQFKKAAYRICLVHFPPQDMKTYESQTVMDIILGIPFDLMLCGHEHNYFSIASMSGICDYKRTGKKSSNAFKLPYPVMANDTDTFVHLQYDGREITTRAITADGELVDEIQLKASV